MAPKMRKPGLPPEPLQALDHPTAHCEQAKTVVLQTGIYLRKALDGKPAMSCIEILRHKPLRLLDP